MDKILRSSLHDCALLPICLFVHGIIYLDPCNIRYDACWVIFLSFKLPEPHLEQDNMVRHNNSLFMEFQLLRTMEQVTQLDLGSYFHNAMLVTTFWLSDGGLSGSLLVTSVSTFACATPAGISTSPNSRLWILSMHDRASPVLCPLGVIDFILNPYFGRRC